MFGSYEILKTNLRFCTVQWTMQKYKLIVYFKISNNYVSKMIKSFDDSIFFFGGGGGGGGLGVF